jgi:hypothetical protein
MVHNIIQKMLYIRHFCDGGATPLLRRLTLLRWCGCSHTGSIHALADYQVSYHVPHDPLTNYNFAQPLPQHSIADYSLAHTIAHN